MMLNQHHNLVVPQSDWLKIGDCVLDIPCREISAPQRALPMRITVKTQQVLLALVSQEGKVVSREALIEWVWPDTLPTDDVLTQAIAQLRKAFCEDRDAPRYLETIAKGGYRLLAPTAWLTEPSGPAPAVADPIALAAPAASAVAQPDGLAVTPVPTASAPGRRRYPSVLVVALVTAVVGLGALLARRPEGATPAAPPPAANAGAALAAAAPEFQRITSLPGSEYWPSVSPDGGQIVYSAYEEKGERAALMVQTTAPVPARPLTQPGKGQSDVMAAWSPDGRTIVFTRVGMDKSCEILLMPSSGGEPRSLGHCQLERMTGYSWHPDGTHLVADGISATDAGPGSIRVLALATGQWQPLSYEKGERDVDMSPTYSPDGQWIAFRRNISLSDLWRMPAAGGRPERLTQLKTNIYGLAWTPDSKAIVFSGYRDGGTLLLRLDVDSGRVAELGIADAVYPSIAIKAPSLAFVLDKSRSMLYSLPVADTDGATAGAPPAPELVFPSTGEDLLPSVAPDGRQIAFISDRSGRIGLWWAELGRPESLRWIEGFMPVPRYAPVWSRDSARMLVVGRTDTNTVVYEVTPATARVQRLSVPASDPIHAEYLPDPSRMLVVADRGEGRVGLILYDRSVSPWRPLASIDDVMLARVDAARQRIVFTRQSAAGLWQSDLELGQPRLVETGLGSWGGRRFVVTREGVRLAMSDDACGLRWAVVPQGKGRSVACLHKEGLMISGMSYDEEHRRLYFSSMQEEGSDIGWMRLAPSSAPLAAAGPATR